MLDEVRRGRVYGGTRLPAQIRWQRQARIREPRPAQLLGQHARFVVPTEEGDEPGAQGELDQPRLFRRLPGQGLERLGPDGRCALRRSGGLQQSSIGFRNEGSVYL